MSVLTKRLREGFPVGLCVEAALEIERLERGIAKQEQMEIAARNLYEYECEFAREAGINERRWALLDRLWATFTKPDQTPFQAKSDYPRPMSSDDRWAGMLRLADEMGISGRVDSAPATAPDVRKDASASSAKDECGVWRCRCGQRTAGDERCTECGAPYNDCVYPMNSKKD
jgi:hypothetical protein